MESTTRDGFEIRVFESRAVLRPVNAGNIGSCALCGIEVKFSAKNLKQQQVIANVYESGAWDRVEHYHPACYAGADEPYGQAIVTENQ